MASWILAGIAVTAAGFSAAGLGWFFAGDSGSGVVANMVVPPAVWGGMTALAFRFR